MKKKFLVMALCVSTCMPVSVHGAEIAGPAASETAQENTNNKEKTVSEETAGESDSGKIEDEITEIQDTVTVAADTDVLDYPGRKEGSVIGTPTPKKLKVASVRIKLPIWMVAKTIMELITFGSTCFKMMMRFGRPMVRAASTYSIFLTESVSPRTVLA